MRLSLFAIAALCVSSLAAHADTVYDYTGQNFTVVYGPYTTSDNVTGSFTVTAPLGDNFSGQFTPLSFSFNDGVQTIDSLNSTASSFDVTTDSSGKVVTQDIVVSNANTSIFDNVIALQTPGDSGQNDYAVGVNGTPGTFTEQAATAPTAVTPEPSSIALLGTGMLGMAGVIRKRLA